MDVRWGLASRRGTENNATFPIILWGVKTASPHDTAIGLLQVNYQGGAVYCAAPPFVLFNFYIFNTISKYNVDNFIS